VNLTLKSHGGDCYYEQQGRFFQLLPALKLIAFPAQDISSSAAGSISPSQSRRLPLGYISGQAQTLETRKMSPQASEQKIYQSVLDFVTEGTFPRSEDVVSSVFPTSALATELKLISKAREQVEVRVQYRNVQSPKC
jgi:hypothetical protein